MRIGLYPGTFDPITLGHVDIITRAMALVDRLVIGVAINTGKGPLFPLEERVEIVEAETREIAARTGCVIEARPFTGLLVGFAKECGAQMIVRGLRAVADFEYEYQMAGMNQQINDRIETVFLMADVGLQPIASRLVKEIAMYGGPIHRFVTPAVAEEVVARVDSIGRRGS